MDPRTHGALDGEVPREALTPAEAAEFESAERMIADVLRAVPSESPDLAPAVLARIAAPAGAGNAAETAAANMPAGAGSAVATPPARHGVTQPGRSLRALPEWLWSPRPLSLTWRPAYVVAAALVLASTMTVASRLQAPPPAMQPVAGTAQVLVQFRLDAPSATEVSLAGDFTDWQPAYALTRAGPGIWTVVVPLDPGLHDYGFIVDGERWQPDPMAPAVDDGFGGLNSRLAILLPDGATAGTR